MVTQSEQQTISVDAVILGGGVAGLFILARLLDAGYSAVLLEKSALGSGQTMKSQGIIHGGTKYTLLGKQTEAQRQIAKMPTYWRQALAGGGEGIPDLSATRLLTEKQLMWAMPKLSSQITGFFAGKLMRSHVDKLEKADRPVALQQAQCQGTFYALDEPVLDVKSMIMAFARQYGEYILTDCQISVNDCCVSVTTAEASYALRAQKVISSAGEGNDAYLDATVGRQQIRPLRMVYAIVPKHFGRLFVHILEASDKPRLTVSSYAYDSDSLVWYLGGNLAEKGAGLTAEQTIDFARSELSMLFPWLNFSDVAFHSFWVNRAEGLGAKEKLGSRPDTPSVFEQGEQIVAYPTKLALAPMLATSVLEKMPKKSLNSSKSLLNRHPESPYFEGNSPRIADFPWENN